MKQMVLYVVLLRLSPNAPLLIFITTISKDCPNESSKGVRGSSVPYAREVRSRYPDVMSQTSDLVTPTTQRGENLNSSN